MDRDTMPQDDAEWKKKLTPEQYRVLREKGTEMPFTGAYVDNHEKGVYRCTGCGAELFSSDAKFDSGTGWPSFYDVATKGRVELREDMSHGMRRTEVICRSCGGHLGHVFDDGPRDKTGKPRISTSAGAKGAGTDVAEVVLRGKRYCINSCALNFEEKK